MEQFYEITPQSKRFAECMTYWNESDKQAEKVRKFMSNHTGRSGRCLDVLRCRHSSMAEHYREIQVRFLLLASIFLHTIESPWQNVSISVILRFCVGLL